MGRAEKKVEDRVVGRTKRLGGECRKYVSPGRRGVPDRIAFLPGLTVFIETKTPIGCLSPLQRSEIRKLLRLSTWVFVCNSTREVDELFDTIEGLGHEKTGNAMRGLRALQAATWSAVFDED